MMNSKGGDLSPVTNHVVSGLQVPLIFLLLTYGDFYIDLVGLLILIVSLHTRKKDSILFYVVTA